MPKRSRLGPKARSITAWGNAPGNHLRLELTHAAWKRNLVSSFANFYVSKHAAVARRRRCGRAESPRSGQPGAGRRPGKPLSHRSSPPRASSHRVRCALLTVLSAPSADHCPEEEAPSAPTGLLEPRIAGPAPRAAILKKLCVARQLQRANKCRQFAKPEFATTINPPEVKADISSTTDFARIALCKRNILAHSAETGKINQDRGTSVASTNFPGRSTLHVIPATHSFGDDLPTALSQCASQFFEVGQGHRKVQAPDA